MNEQIRFLQDLSNTLSQEVVRELIDIFQRQFQEMNPLIRQHAEKRDFETVSRLAHTMKSSSRNVASMDMAQIYQIIEKNPENVLADRLLESIELHYRIYMQSIDSWRMSNEQEMPNVQSTNRRRQPF